MPMTPSGTRTRSMVMPFGPGPGRDHGADRVLEAGHHLDAGRHGLDPGVIERQPVEEGGGGAAGARLGHVLGIGGQNGRLAGPDRRRHGLERMVFLPGGRERQHARGRARGPADIGHGRGDIAGAFDAFERRGHLRKRLVCAPGGRVVLSRRGFRREIGLSPPKSRVF